MHEQQDASELYHYLLEILDSHENVANLHRKSFWGVTLGDWNHNLRPLNPLKGTLVSSLTCQSCKQERLNLEHFVDIPLNISKGAPTLTNCLKEFVAPELLTEVLCETCEKKRSFTKKLSISRAPPAICFTFRRLTMGTFSASKNGAHVEFPEQLDLSPYLSNYTANKDPQIYKLSAIIEHHGGNDGFTGHFTTYRKHPAQQQGGAQNWFHISDLVTQPVGTVKGARAYMLFYEKQAN